MIIWCWKLFELTLFPSPRIDCTSFPPLLIGLWMMLEWEPLVLSLSHLNTLKHGNGRTFAAAAAELNTTIDRMRSFRKTTFHVFSSAASSSSLHLFFFLSPNLIFYTFALIFRLLTNWLILTFSCALKGIFQLGRFTEVFWIKEKKDFKK